MLSLCTSHNIGIARSVTICMCRKQNSYVVPVLEVGCTGYRQVVHAEGHFGMENLHGLYIGSLASFPGKEEDLGMRLIGSLATYSSLLKSYTR